MAEEKKTSEKAEKKDEKKAPAKKPAKKNKKNPFKSIVAFFKSVKSEGKKVVWAKPAEVFRNTIIVLVVVFIVGLAIFAVDTVLTKGMGGIKDYAASLKEETTVTEEVDETADTEYDLVEDTADDSADTADTEVDADADAEAAE